MSPKDFSTYQNLTDLFAKSVDGNMNQKKY